MVCNKCQFINSSDSSFCEKCGNPLTVECKKCGRRFSTGTAFCDNCGSSLKKVEVTTPGDYTPMPPTYPGLAVILFLLPPYGFFAGIRHVIRAARVRKFYRCGDIEKAYDWSKGLKIGFFIQLFISAAFIVAVIILVATA
jgi:RNA polymerase subunit RPABC4/transcription elongation factor Spt4